MPAPAAPARLVDLEEVAALFDSPPDPQEAQLVDMFRSVALEVEAGLGPAVMILRLRRLSRAALAHGRGELVGVGEVDAVAGELASGVTR